MSATKAMLHGIYVGPLKHLQGKTALMRPLERTQVLVQFDDTTATREPELLASRPSLVLALSLGFGWHEFPAADFMLSASNCLAVQHADAMSCRLCDLAWDKDDSSPPTCRRNVQRDYTVAEWWDDLEGTPWQSTG